MSPLWDFLKGFLALFAGLLMALSGGCTPADLIPKMFPQEMGAAFNNVAMSMVDQTDWSEVAANVDGHAVNPGVKAWMSITVECGAGLDGLDGDVHLAGTGEGVRALSDDARDVLLEQYRSATSSAQRKFILELLGYADNGAVDVPVSGP